VLFVAVPIYRGLNCRVDELDNKHEEQASDKYSAFERSLPEPECRGQQDNDENQFLPESSLVFPRSR
jgi:hypothetical protein